MPSNEQWPLLVKNRSRDLAVQCLPCSPRADIVSIEPPGARDFELKINFKTLPQSEVHWQKLRESKRSLNYERTYGLNRADQLAKTGCRPRVWETGAALGGWVGWSRRLGVPLTG